MKGEGTEIDLTRYTNMMFDEQVRRSYPLNMKAAWLRDELFASALKANVFSEFPMPPITRTRWERLKLWIDAHWPRIHFGPCDHSDCGDY